MQGPVENSQKEKTLIYLLRTSSPPAAPHLGPVLASCPCPYESVLFKEVLKAGLAGVKFVQAIGRPAGGTIKHVTFA